MRGERCSSRLRRGTIDVMGFWNSLKRKREQQIEERRSAAFLKARSKGATPDQARRSADRAAKSQTNSAVTGAINS